MAQILSLSPHDHSGARGPGMIAKGPLPHEPKRRSIRIDDRMSSIQMEEAFWTAIGEIAASHGTSVAKVVQEICDAYSGANLSSGIRTFIVQYFAKVAANHGEPVQIRSILKTW